MTEAEKTALAMRSAQAAREGKGPVIPDEVKNNTPILDEKTPKPQEKTEPAKEVKTKEPKVSEPKQTKPLNTVELGEGRDVVLSPWKGSTVKKFKKAFEFAEDIDDVDFERVMEVLIYDHISNDVLLLDAEQQYILAKLSELSLQDDYKVEVNCPKCQGVNTIKGKINEVQFNPAKLPHNYGNIVFAGYKKSKYDEQVKKILEDDDYDGVTTKADISTACMIRIGNKSPAEVIDYLDNLPVKDLKKLIKEFESVMPEYKHTKVLECRHCNSDEEFDINIITNIFEGLMS